MPSCGAPLASRQPVIVADNASRTVLMSSPKAGVTQTTMLMLSMLNLTREALSYANVHEYRLRVFDKSSAHRRDQLCDDCGDRGQWTCVRFLRSPLDRIVSSYLTWSLNKAYWPELGLACPGSSENASFAQFVMALSAVVNSSERQTRAFDSHVMPQTPLRACGGELSRLLEVPLEAMPHALRELEQLRKLHDAGAVVWPSLHYKLPKVSLQAAAADVSSWPWPPVKAAMFSERLPAYDNFLTSEICRKLSCLFASDFSAYTRMCAQPEI
ncbi:hypothetical protein AB1Y20_001973 [Prymnesium parvum]|uniref:Carbohydrate sulfotransferase n=1 Tax=Prymnesium parvum TaxID=97485 RepID=A0AB34JAC0_PRYPA